MAILSEIQRADLAAELAKPEYDGLDDEDAAELLNVARVVPSGNAPIVPLPFTAAAFIGKLTGESPAKVFASPGVTALQADIAAQKRDNCINWVVFAWKSNVITLAERDDLLGLLQATGPQPGWPETVVVPSAFQALAFGPIELPSGEIFDGTCTPEMIAEARD